MTYIECVCGKIITIINNLIGKFEIVSKRKSNPMYTKNLKKFP